MSNYSDIIPMPFNGYYYTKQQAAKLKGVNPRTIQQWIDKDWISSIYFGGTWHIEATSIENFTPPKPGPRPTKKQ